MSGQYSFSCFFRVGLKMSSGGIWSVTKFDAFVLARKFHFVCWKMEKFSTDDAIIYAPNPFQ